MLDQNLYAENVGQQDEFLTVVVAELAGAHEIGTDGAADRAGAPDQERRRAYSQPSVRSSRVSATPTAQTASISLSGR